MKFNNFLFDEKILTNILNKNQKNEEKQAEIRR